MTTSATTPELEARPLPRPRLRDQVGLVRRIAREPHVVLDEMAARYGPVCQVGAGPMRGAIVGDPAALREMFSTSTDRFRWNHRANVLRVVVGDASMLASDGDDHKRRRGSVAAAFSRRRLNRWIPMIVERCDAAIDDLLAATDGRTPVDLYPVGRDIVFDVVMRAFFGERMVSRTDELAERFEAAQAYLESPGFRQLPHPFPFTARARVKAGRREIDAIIDGEIAHHRSSPTDDPYDVLAALVAHDDLSDDEIRDQVKTLIGAGYHTTAASLAWTLWCAVTAPGLWARIGAEADEVFGRGGPDETTLAGLELTDRVMRETLRLHPAGVVGLREAVTDVTIGGYLVPRRTIIVWSPHLAGRNADAWPDPLRFDPDRFLDPTDEQRAAADAAWVPFGRGARNCIGFALAQMEITLIAARMAQRLVLDPGGAGVPEPHGMVVNRPAGGVPMRVTRRQPAAQG